MGTEYNWYILANQHVKKLNANDYSTEMTGLKFKLAHKRADKDKWSLSDKARKKHLIKILENIIVGLYDDIKMEKIIKPAKKAARRKKAVEETAWWSQFSLRYFRKINHWILVFYVIMFDF